MKTFIAKLKDLLGTARHPTSIAPRDVLFEAQRHFLEKNFSYKGVREHAVDVTMPTNGGPIVFACDLATREDVYAVVAHIVDGDWGDFEVKKVTFSNADPAGRDYTFLRARFLVDVKGAE